jgi:hypothetical protein
METERCVVDAAGRKTEEGVFTLSGVATGVASVRGWSDCSRCRQKRKTGERNKDDEVPECFELKRLIHTDAFFFRPAA